MHPIPLSLYIHVPWCIRKCPYCDFNSHESKQIPEQDYIDSLIQDLMHDKTLAQGRTLQTLFIGGGTPSLFSAEGFVQLLQRVNDIIPIDTHAEITMEANPGTFELKKFKGFRNAGINRLSIGVQSFNPDHLTALGRIHNRDEAIIAIESARNVGFEKLNIDLMHGLPNQSLTQAMADLEQAIALQPTHLSWYQLTIEPNTVFYSKPPLLPEDDALWDIDQTGKQLLSDNDFHQYETSAFSKPGFQCAHNVNYWMYGDYLAIGAGAHGKITHIENKTIQRYQKTRLPNDYLNPEKSFTAKSFLVTDNELPFEFFMNTFRLFQPINKNLFKERTFLDGAIIEPQIKHAIEKQLIQSNANSWQTTELGQRFLNSLLELF